MNQTTDLLQRQRFEYKYRIDETRALAIRDYVQAYLDVDRFGATQPNLSYPVHSIYLDSPSLKTFQDTINGERNRYKLRIRYYENGDDAPVFFEMKRRINQIIAKKRAKVHRTSAAKLVAGYLPQYDDLIENNPEHLETMQHISTLINQIQAKPKVHVSYLREAWMRNGDNSVRVTMDRSVVTEPVNQLKFSNDMTNPESVFGNIVILELKFTNRFPHWFQTLVQTFGLRQQSAAKYVDGVHNLGIKNKLKVHIYNN